MDTLIATHDHVASITRGAFDNIDAQARQMSGYDQRYQQLSRGGFHGRFVTYAFGEELGINVEHTNRALLQGGSTPRARHALCFVAADSTPATLNGQIIAADSAVYWDGGYSFEAHLAEESTIWVIDIADSLLDSPLERTVRRGTVTSGRSVAEARRSIVDGIDHFTRNASAALHDAAVRSYCGEVAAKVNALVSLRPLRGTTRLVPREQRLRLFRRARDYIHGRLENGININELCVAASASRRALENAFLKTVHVTPYRYVRALQLNEIRRDLLRNDVAPQPLGDVAARWGIWHWSRFSREYNETFGELPSQTRRRQSRGCRRPTGSGT